MSKTSVYNVYAEKGALVHTDRWYTNLSWAIKLFKKLKREKRLTTGPKLVRYDGEIVNGLLETNYSSFERLK